MKKERHPVYRLVLAVLFLLLAVGVTLFVCALSVGNSPFMLAPARTV